MMADFELVFSIGNAAFWRDDSSGEDGAQVIDHEAVAATVEGVAAMLRDGKDVGVVRDVNGSAIGRFALQVADD